MASNCVHNKKKIMCVWLKADYFELEMPVQSDLVISLKATCSNILRADTVSSICRLQ